MIISHKHKFIFVKTRKTAGTSTELALCKVLGPEDIVTPTRESHDELRKAIGVDGLKTYRKAFYKYSLKDLYVYMKVGHPAFEYWHHMPAKVIRERVGEEIWNTYYKFTIERNPWDKVVSQHFHYNRVPGRDITFKQFVTGERFYGPTDFELYAIDGQLAMDKVVLYENLQGGLDEVRDHLNLESRIDVSGIHANADSRAKEKRDYAEMYDEKTRRIVEIEYAREIALFNYTF